jgi:hypothetical protein
MFITTTLGGIVLVVTFSAAMGTVTGVLVRPKLERVRDRVRSAVRRTSSYVNRTDRYFAADDFRRSR